MTLSVAEQNRRTQVHNAKIAERNVILNKILAICETPKTADQIASAFNFATGNVFSQNIILLTKRGYLKACGMVLIDKYKKRTQYVTIKHGFNEGYKSENSMTEKNPNNPHMRIVHGADYIRWRNRESCKQEVRIGSTMGMLS